eukprot:XP_014618187.1 ornithine aminotransferase, mitochondrial-like [Glycine max]
MKSTNTTADGTNNPATPKWIEVKSHVQSGGYECGYYVMHWMWNIVSGGLKNDWSMWFLDGTTLDNETITTIRQKWAAYFLKAIIVSCCGCFHGRTLGVISLSCDNEATRGFGPLLPGNLKVDFGDVEALERIFKEKGEHIAVFILEPIQGEAGVSFMEVHVYGLANTCVD